VWRCEKCGREFERESQDHYCEALVPQTIDEYLALQDESLRPLLEEVRAAIRAAAPEASEKISWRMPTFWQQENLIHFAAFKKHIGLYPGDKAVKAFAARLDEEGFAHSKGTVQLPYTKPLPLKLVSDITAYRVKAVCDKRTRP
jgi:uncharacterized protein YdhG (YjbR/CyaY superfamily)